MVGDTLSDYNVSKGNCSWFVWAAYGFGMEESNGADYRIESPVGLIKVIEELEAH
jgi:phosphoglycolate phosphatase-like HAD superfamily hydrolase